MLFENEDNLDPLLSSKFSLSELQKICDENEIRVAKKSLNAELTNWKNGEKVICKDWIQNLLGEISAYATRFNMHDQLKPIYRVIKEGNKSMQWISKYNKGYTINEIMRYEIDLMIKSEEEII